MPIAKAGTDRRTVGDPRGIGCSPYFEYSQGSSKTIVNIGSVYRLSDRGRKDQGEAHRRSCTHSDERALPVCHGRPGRAPCAPPFDPCGMNRCHVRSEGQPPGWPFAWSLTRCVRALLSPFSQRAFDPSCKLMILVAPPGLEPGLSALKGPRVNQLHHGAIRTTTSSPLQLYAVCFVETEEEKILVALPGLEPGLFALRGRRVNQLHHNARSVSARRKLSPGHSLEYSRFSALRQGKPASAKRWQRCDRSKANPFPTPSAISSAIPSYALFKAAQKKHLRPTQFSPGILPASRVAKSGLGI
jgi:hypothetical protein